MEMLDDVLKLVEKFCVGELDLAAIDNDDGVLKPVQNELILLFISQFDENFIQIFLV